MNSAPFLILELGSRFVDGYYYQASAASSALGRYRTAHPEGRWIMTQLRAEPERPTQETMLPLSSIERQRLLASEGPAL